MTPEEARRLFQEFHDLVTGKEAGADPAPELGKLAAFSGVCEFPIRVKCATLAWHALKAALDGAGQLVSTE
jgi:nitrogen fixation NifU-like protein